ncbi:MAG: SRPBCC family protein [Pseudomonadota bacterium]
MWIVFTILAVTITIALIYLAMQEADYHVKRSLEIEASTNAVFNAILDFKSWPEWSPWLMHEPEAGIQYSEQYQEEGGHYVWDGKFVGAGKLTHVSINAGRSIHQEIEFIRPFKSKNEVRWSFEPMGENCLVTWEMIGRMPFLFRFMTRQMEPMIGRDYELGLALFNGYMNAQAPHPNLTFSGIEELDNFSYWAIPCHGNLRHRETTRRSSIETLEAAAGGTSGLPLTLLHQFTPTDMKAQAEVAIPITEKTPSSNYTRREFNGGRYFKLTVLGDHQFLPLAWYALSSHCRMHRIKTDPTRPSLEIYLDEPSLSGSPNDRECALYLAIK